MSYFSDYDTKNKLLILYFIKSSGIEIGEEDLLSIIMEKKWMDYFEFALSISEMKDSGFIKKEKKLAGERLILCPNGEEVLEGFYKRIPKSLRDSVDQYNDENRARLQRRGENRAQYHKAEDGSYVAEFAIIDKDIELLSVSINLPNIEMAKSFVSKWEEKAGNIYSYMISELG